MPTAKPIAIEIFRAGRHVDMHGRAFDLTTADLAAIASGYDPARHEAPLVIGHPQLNAPAYGWVKGLRVDGNTLVADTHQVDPAFAEVVAAGRYKKRSASFLLPTAPDNPAPGQYYLNHVGFLGAAPPAVKGLRDAQFAAADQCAEFAIGERNWAFGQIATVLRRLREYFIESQGVEKADLLMPGWTIDSIAEAAQPDTPAEVSPNPSFAAPVIPPLEHSMPSPDQQSAEFAAREQALNTKAADIVAREQALAAREQQARRDDAAAFASGLVESGQLLPRDAATVTELLLVLPTDTPLSFAAADGSTTTVQPAAALREFLTALPPRVHYPEKSAPDATPAVASFATPPGETVDAAELAVHQKAVAFVAAHPGTPYLAAVAAVSG
ncbi:MAG TPA: hypothetical protein VFN09_04925 [Rhodanobacteraceae bacterium]|nr:hypothetical protein [Rhodanobacteraceae bacterium]